MVSCRDALSSDSPKIEGIEGNRPLKRGKFSEIRRRSHWPSVLPMSSRVRLGFGRLPCSRSGLSEVAVGGRRLRNFCIFFFKLIAPTAQIQTQTDTQTQTEKWIFRDLEDCEIMTCLLSMPKGGAIVRSSCSDLTHCIILYLRLISKFYSWAELEKD